MKHSKEDREDALRTLELVAEKLEAGGLLIVVIKRTSKSNLTWYAEIRLAYQNEQGQIDTLWLTWMFAVLTESSLTARQELRWSSLGIERGFELTNHLKALIEVHSGRKISMPNWLTIA